MCYMYMYKGKKILYIRTEENEKKEKQHSLLSFAKRFGQVPRILLLFLHLVVCPRPCL